MKKSYFAGAVTGMGIGFPITLLCMAAIGGYNEVVREFGIWMVASALYGLLSVTLFNRKDDLPPLLSLSLHFAGITAITLAAALLNGYITRAVDVAAVLIPAFVIYAAITGVFAFLSKRAEKQVNKALEEKE